ncbi:MAG: hypothetical protein ACKOX3_02350 [Bacteroidota bacterium]
MKNTISFIIASIFILSCNQNKQTPNEIKVEEKGKVHTETSHSETSRILNTKSDSSYNNLAQLIAGYPINFYPSNWNSEFIHSFNQNVNQKMAGIEYNRLNKIREWNRENMNNNQANDSSFVFYPFSGGDFIHVSWLYPNANEYFMIAREDVGDIPNLFSKDSAFTNQYLRDIEFVLRDIYNKSYFITKNMSADTKHNTKVNGMLPLILWGAARTGHDITQVKFGNIDEQGNFVSTAHHTKSNVVQITLWNRKLNKQQKVTYFCCDLANNQLIAHPGNLIFLEHSISNNSNTFLKSASYLMHYASFTSIKDFTLKKSNYLVQDDTGIPYKNFNDANWKVTLFGIYEKPVKDFIDDLYQEDLDSAYHVKGNARDLNFSLGYHWSSKKQNQLVAKRIN